ncbi:amino acid ABC transporter ATP-binding protein [Pseudohalocynthiibacter aestuariivivens]|uniref:Amino acid ABC transporter ATP-binding protein n=1 Tax=Roseovarius pelagicus TaxID=2980108 RepID=A0ABY6D9H8_9RHOB|nr:MULTISPECIES: amino acid ABC transporter ATP-binding protein [Rhodobacterales]QIE45304.1 amino acid ABC transporter ATP-binding protein [Pseudohalocynthiibacter aestuariivivens]UXX82781.1 amino acid ABC transporter ATP-binding protein [Roseovarius pelagicus]
MSEEQSPHKAPLNVDPILELTDIRKKFGALEVLKGVSLSVSPGESLSIIGASGSGKSTLLRCVNLFEKPTSGRIRFDGKDVEYGDNLWFMKRERILRNLRREVGMVFQSYNLWPHMTVLENVIESPIQAGLGRRAEIIELADGLLDKIGMREKRNEYPSRLSGGQQQRVAIIRALAMSPKILLLDEVTSALDPELVGEVLELIAQLAAEGVTMLVVTHEIAFARDVSDRTIFLHKGVIEEEGPSAEVLGAPTSEHAQKFLRRVLHPNLKQAVGDTK